MINISYEAIECRSTDYWEVDTLWDKYSIRGKRFRPINRDHCTVDHIRLEKDLLYNIVMKTCTFIHTLVQIDNLLRFICLFTKYLGEYLIIPCIAIYNVLVYSFNCVTCRAERLQHR